MTMNANRKLGNPWSAGLPSVTGKASKAPAESAERRQLQALGSLGERAIGNPGELFEKGLALLVKQLGVSRAVVATRTELGLEALWNAPEGPVPDPAAGFCPEVLTREDRTLVIRDAATDPMWSDHTAWTTGGVRSYVGTVLRHSGKAFGVLSVQDGKARVWKRTEVAMVNILAHWFSRAFEVEALRSELWRTQEALDLTSAVVEDSALESPQTGLPNRHYLDVWIRSSLFLARRRGETMAVATWVQPKERNLKRTLKCLADSLRGEDLLVDMGHDRMLLLLPRTTQAGAAVLLDRVRLEAGQVTLGATLWNPLLKPDREDKSLETSFHRAHAALASASLGEVNWNLLEPSRENLIDGPGHWETLEEELN